MYMGKNRVLSLLVTTVLLMSCNMLLFANADSKGRKKEDDNETVVGDFFIIPSHMRYAGYESYGRWLGNLAEINDCKTTIYPKAVLVGIWATSRDNRDEKHQGGGSDNWSCHGNLELPGRFPDYLPLKYLEGLREGDKLSGKICKKGECKNFELIARQLAYRYRRMGSFQEALEKEKEDFSKYPDYSLKDEKKLIEAGILKKVTGKNDK